MAKQIILYNLAENITEEQYEAYVTSEKGPLLDSFESVKKFEVAKTTGSLSGEIPYKYVGIMHLTSLDDFNQKDAVKQEFQEFLAKWMPMVSDFHILFCEEVY
jgi:hypothetical protein